VVKKHLERLEADMNAFPVLDLAYSEKYGEKEEGKLNEGMMGGRV
jgi:hypothetical protein